MKNHRLLGGVLLVAGTTIGAGMLALPISTGAAGFIPSLLLFVAVWAFMTYTALLLLEVNLSMKGETNLISMAGRTLGSFGQAYSWVTYLFLLYALNTAYIAGSGPSFIQMIEFATGIKSIPEWVGAMPLLLIFGHFVYHGTRSVDLVNRILMTGLIIAYIMLILFVTPNVDPSQLLRHDSKYLLISTSVIVTSFGFHIIIPTLAAYTDRNVQLMKKAILIGSFIALMVYIVWECLTLGVAPLEGDEGILVAYQQGHSGAHVLAMILGNSWISLIARFFSFFAIVTSFLGVALSLTDFLADGLRIEKTHKGRIFLCLLTFLPPLAISLTFPRAFISALEYAGGYGVVTLLCLLPALMVWRARYVKKMESPYRAPGGKAVLIAVIAVSLILIALEAVNKLGWLPVGIPLK